MCKRDWRGRDDAPRWFLMVGTLRCDVPAGASPAFGQRNLGLPAEDREARADGRRSAPSLPKMVGTKKAERMWLRGRERSDVRERQRLTLSLGAADGAAHRPYHHTARPAITRRLGSLKFTAATPSPRLAPRHPSLFFAFSRFFCFQLSQFQLFSFQFFSF